MYALSASLNKITYQFAQSIKELKKQYDAAQEYFDNNAQHNDYIFSLSETKEAVHDKMIADADKEVELLAKAYGLEPSDILYCMEEPSEQVRIIKAQINKHFDEAA